MKPAFYISVIVTSNQTALPFKQGAIAKVGLSPDNPTCAYFKQVSAVGADNSDHFGAAISAMGVTLSDRHRVTFLPWTSILSLHGENINTKG